VCCPWCGALLSYVPGATIYPRPLCEYDGSTYPYQLPSQWVCVACWYVAPESTVDTPSPT
jgi:hypothetical protein